ncbi:MAG: hypothetical protein V4663_12855 [Bacteroidota bacterium]
MKIRSLIYIPALLLILSGVGDTLKASKIEFQEPLTEEAIRNESRTTAEGIFELGTGSILLLLAEYFKANKFRPLKSISKYIVSEINLPFDNSDVNDEDFTQHLNAHRTDFIYLIYHEFGEDVSRAVRITKIEFLAIGSKLIIKTSLNILAFAGEKVQNAFLDGITKFLMALAEEKMNHLKEKLTDDIGNLDGYSPPVRLGENWKELLSMCFKEEIINADKGIKILTNSSFFPNGYKL